MEIILVGLIVAGVLLGYGYLFRGRYDKRYLTLMCAVGSFLAGVSGLPFGPLRSLLLGMALFGALPVVEKASAAHPGLSVGISALIGALFGAAAGVLEGLLEMSFPQPSSKPLWLLTACFTLYGLLVHGGFKRCERFPPLVRYLVVLLAMWLAYLAGNYELVWQTDYPEVILTTMAAGATACAFLSLMVWLPMEFLKQALCVELNFPLQVKQITQASCLAVGLIVLLGLPTVGHVLQVENYRFRLANNNLELKKELSGVILTKQHYVLLPSEEKGKHPKGTDLEAWFTNPLPEEIILKYKDQMPRRHPSGAIAYVENKQLRLSSLDKTSSRVIFDLHDHRLRNYAFSPDGQYVVLLINNKCLLMEHSSYLFVQKLDSSEGRVIVGSAFSKEVAWLTEVPNGKELPGVAGK
jgi:hypothetical protein